MPLCSDVDFATGGVRDGGIVVVVDEVVVEVVVDEVVEDVDVEVDDATVVVVVEVVVTRRGVAWNATGKYRSIANIWSSNRMENATFGCRDPPN